MLISRRLRQPLQPFFKARSFSVDDYLDSVDVDSDLEEDAAPVKKVRTPKRSKDSLTGLNPKQKAEVLQQFYDAAEKSLK